MSSRSEALPAIGHEFQHKALVLLVIVPAYIAAVIAVLMAESGCAVAVYHSAVCGICESAAAGAFDAGKIGGVGAVI